MRYLRILLTSLAAAAAALPASTAAQQPGWFGGGGARSAGGWYPSARVWLEDQREVLRRGERLRVRFSTSEDAYVAVIHIDSDGTLEFLYPSSPWDDGYAQGGRSHPVPRGASYAGVPLRGGPGIGYLYVVASPVPLDFGYFGGGYGRGWDWSYAGGVVRGDPFWALEEITQLLVGDWGRAPYVSDVYSYYVEGRHRYPSYACSSHGYAGERGWGWAPAYGPCSGMDPFLRRYPGYYDTRLYRGDRRPYYRDGYARGYDRRYDRDRRSPAPEHGYKEEADRAPARARPPLPRSGSQGSTGQQAPRVERREQPAPDAPDRRRPTLERRGSEPRGGSAAPAAPRPTGGRPSGAQAKPAPRAQPRNGYVRPQSPPPSTPERRPSGRGGGERPAPPNGSDPAR